MKINYPYPYPFLFKGRRLQNIEYKQFSPVNAGLGDGILKVLALLDVPALSFSFG